MLYQLGCETGQGYFLGRPAPANTLFLEHLDKRRTFDAAAITRAQPRFARTT